MNEDIYVKHGYQGRHDYLSSLAEEYGLAPELVAEVAALLGPAEDFDGLLSELQDRCGLGW